MTPEELLKPRYKVIADYPGNNHYKLGGIITDDGVRPAINENGYPVFVCDWKEYPHLFRKLEWWEDREPSEMPEYVKDDEGKVFKVSAFSPRGSSVILWLINKLDGNSLYESYSLKTSSFSVSTKEEYDNQ